MKTKIRKFKDWRHLITRDLPLVRFYIILESYAERTLREWGWLYSGGCTVSRKGILDIYRRDFYLTRGANHFINLKNKKGYLKKVLVKSKSSAKEVNSTIALINKKLSPNTSKEELIQLFKISYEKFKEFWTVQNFTFTLDASLRYVNKAEYLEKYRKQVMEMRKATQDKTIALEQLIDKIIKLLAKKLKINETLLENATPKEIINNKINLLSLKKRARAFVIIVQDKQIKVFTNPKIISKWSRYLTKINGRASDLKTNEIKGKPAYQGNIKGKVKVIIDKKNLIKIKKGDILVTPMTEVDYVPYLEKVSAIITNEGGITCHAAIISRELKIPCIIGTKIATKVLKDSDIVEVDANKGLIKVIKRAR